MTESQQILISNFLKLSHNERCDIVELLRDYLADEPYKFEKSLIDASRADFVVVKRPRLRLVG